VKKIWIYAEENSDGIDKVAYELLAKAKDCAASYGEETEIGAVLLTEKLGDKAKVLAEYGADKVYLAEGSAFGLYNHLTFGPVVAKLIHMEDPDIFLFGATAIGSELAPTVAAIVKTGVAAHCIDLRINEEKMLVADVPAFGGKIIGEILIPYTRPQMASVKPGIFTYGDAKKGAEAELVKINTREFSLVDQKLRPIKVETVKSTSKPLEDAEIVIAGGYGLGSKKNWERIEELAELLGGAAGATRPCVDECWARGEQIMIGTSGKSIRPKVYVAFGISGASHHICGMKDSGTIISVNEDENAAIFGVSDCYAAVDLNEVLPKLIENIKALKKVN